MVLPTPNLHIFSSGFGVTVLGIVPSQLRAWQGPKAKPQSLRLLITWAERTPPKLAREWSQDPWIPWARMDPLDRLGPDGGWMELL